MKKDSWALTCQKSLMASRSCASAQSKPAISEHAQELHAVDFSPQFLTIAIVGIVLMLVIIAIGLYFQYR